jgi:hypothetical protein
MRILRERVKIVHVRVFVENVATEFDEVFDVVDLARYRSATL